MFSSNEICVSPVPQMTPSVVSTDGTLLHHSFFGGRSDASSTRDFRVSAPKKNATSVFTFHGPLERSDVTRLKGKTAAPDTMRLRRGTLSSCFVIVRVRLNVSPFSTSSLTVIDVSVFVTSNVSSVFSETTDKEAIMGCVSTVGMASESGLESGSR